MRKLVGLGKIPRGLHKATSAKTPLECRKLRKLGVHTARNLEIHKLIRPLVLYVNSLLHHKVPTHDFLAMHLRPLEESVKQLAPHRIICEEFGSGIDQCKPFKLTLE